MRAKKYKLKNISSTRQVGGKLTQEDFKRYISLIINDITKNYMEMQNNVDDISTQMIKNHPGVFEALESNSSTIYNKIRNELINSQLSSN